MARNFQTPIDLNGLEIQNVALQNLANDPSSVSGKIYFNTGSNKIKFYNGSAWVTLEDSGSLTGVQSVSGSAPISASTSSGNVTVSITAATTSAAGSMSGADKTKLDNATNSNTASTLVMRDGSGNFSAGTITATLSGSASQLNNQSASYYLNRSNHTGTQTASTISDLAATVKSYRLDEFSTPTSNLDLGSRRITNLADPVSDNDAANKKYVDSARAGLDIKDSVRAATTGNITLSGTQTVDGVALSVGDRVLVKNQSTGSANGIYVVASGAWSRAADAGTGNISSGMFTFVEEGTDNDNTGWVLTTNNPITVGTTSLVFAQFSGAGSITAGNGLSKTGDTMSAVGTTNRITVGAGGIDIASNYVGQASITTLGTISTGTWQGSVISAAYGGTGISSYTTGNYINAASASTLQQRTPAQVRSDISAVEANSSIAGATKTKITYDSKGLVTAGADLAAADIPGLDTSKITSGTFDSARLPTITVSKGGTGLTTVATNSYLKGNGTSNLVPRTYSEVKTDLSLNNVENIAISSWAGSSNITTLGTVTTGTWNATTIAVANGGTGATTASGARSNIGAITKYATDIGNGSATTFAITHGLNSQDVTVAVYEKASPYQEVVCDVAHTSTSKVDLTFATAPANNEYRVVVTG